VNVVAFCSPRRPEWRWRIVDQTGDVLEESSTSFATIAEATAAGTEQLERRRERDRPAPARVPLYRRR
jgi:hypothetical protein